MKLMQWNEKSCVNWTDSLIAGRLLPYHRCDALDRIRQLMLAARQVAASGDVYRSRPDCVRMLCVVLQTTRERICLL